MKSVFHGNASKTSGAGSMIRLVFAAIAAMAFALPSLGWTPHADALTVVPYPAAGPCTYSVNYLCTVSGSSEIRSKNQSVTATGNCARDTSTTALSKLVGYGTGIVYTTKSGTADTLCQTFSRRSTELFCAIQPPAGVPVGCNYTR